MVRTCPKCGVGKPISEMKGHRLCRRCREEPDVEEDHPIRGRSVEAMWVDDAASWDPPDEP